MQANVKTSKVGDVSSSDSLHRLNQASNRTCAGRIRNKSAIELQPVERISRHQQARRRHISTTSAAGAQGTGKEEISIKDCRGMDVHLVGMWAASCLYLGPI
jgi:hypothetical protein